MSSDDRIHHGARRNGSWLLLLAVLLPALSSAAPPPDAAKAAPARSAKIRIGRIFFSPAERRSRHEDRARSGTGLPGADHAAHGERLQVNGAVSSSLQGRAVWVNGSLIEDSAKLKSAWTDRGGNIWLRDDRQIPRSVRAGQALDPASGAIEDLLPSGSVARR